MHNWPDLQATMWLQPAMPSTAPQESSSQSSSSMARPSLASLACRERRTLSTFGRKPWKNPWPGRQGQEDSDVPLAELA